MAAADPEPTPPAPSPGRGRQAPRRAAAAVLGSVAALGGASGAMAQTTRPGPTDRQPRHARRAEAPPAGERVLLGRVFSALSARAPSIARPVLAQGVADGTITQAEEDRFLARLTGPAAHPAVPPTSPAARELFQRALAAIRAELPSIAAPMVSEAAADGSITAGEAARLRARLSRGPQLGFGLIMRNARAAGATRLP